MKRALLIMFLVFLLMQLIRTSKVEYSSSKEYELEASKEVKEILVRACYDCHSNEIVYPWYSEIAPFSWVISNHTVEGVRALNFSIWKKYTVEEKEKKLEEIYRTIYSIMPLPSYVLVHDVAKLKKEERELVRDWTGVRKR